MLVFVELLWILHLFQFKMRFNCDDSCYLLIQYFIIHYYYYYYILMKLNTNYKLKIFLIVTIFSIYHFFIHNGLEKIFYKSYFDYNDIRRPSKFCDSKFNCDKLYCAGMPSGHVEVSTIFSSLLYLNNIIPLWICLVIIFINKCHRLIFNKHTLLQVTVGLLFGLLYTFIYNFFKLSIFGFLIVACIGFIIALLSIYKIDQNVYGPIPSWVDKNMLSSIKKKQDSPFYIKVGSLYFNAVVQSNTFVCWNKLENYLDIIIDKIQKSGKKYNAVVGIKTGGAIISDYISFKLGIPNYKIKLSKKEYNCDKKPIDTIKDMIQKRISTNLEDYSICEGINENLEGKNIILIDELVSSGKTMEESYNYLKQIKYVNEIYPTCIAFYKSQYKSKLNINNVFDGTVLIWPWGYDN
jgi:hypoxanthine phosphoribosyltransferase/membrane-associated phospholipid phosphatase